MGHERTRHQRESVGIEAPHNAYLTLDARQAISPIQHRYPNLYRMDANLAKNRGGMKPYSRGVQRLWEPIDAIPDDKGRIRSSLPMTALRWSGH